MTDITPEQRAAWDRIEQSMGEIENPEVDRADWSLIATLLPAELTNPQPELPTEPGRYESSSGDSAWLLDASGKWSYDGEYDDLATEPEQYAPFTRLVPERPAITPKQIVHILGRLDLDKQCDAILALVNGKGAES